MHKSRVNRTNPEKHFAGERRFLRRTDHQEDRQAFLTRIPIIQRQPVFIGGQAFPGIPILRALYEVPPGRNRSVYAHIREILVDLHYLNSILRLAVGLYVWRMADQFADQFTISGEANAGKHAYWQAMLTHYLDVETAHNIAEAHEYGATDLTDTWIDRYNNHLGRRLGASAVDEEAIEQRVLNYVASEHLIIRRNDSRIPEELRSAGP